MNLNNEWQIKRNIENRLLKDNPRFGKMFVDNDNLFSWWKITKNDESIIRIFFGNLYDARHHEDLLIQENASKIGHCSSSCFTKKRIYSQKEIIDNLEKIK